MASDRRRRGWSYLARALITLAASVVVHFASAHVLLTLLLEGTAAATSPGPRAATTFVVMATALGMLALLYLRSQYSSPDHVTRSVPAALRMFPPLTAAAWVPLNFVPSQLSTTAIIQTTIPVIAATWASALLLALLLAQTLHGLAVRAPPGSLMGVLRTFEPPSVARNFARILVSVCCAATLVVLGAIAPRFEAWSNTAELHTFAAMVALVAMVVVAGVAGASLGQSPGREIVSIARRFDALGYNTRQTMDWPVVPTSFDEVGRLFARLEALRLRLTREATTYQQALDKTRAADLEKAAFLGTVSHELRTPLNSVVGFAQLLLEDEALTSAQAEDVRLIQAGGHQLLELINDILDISMIESGELRLSFAPVDVREVLRDVVRIHQPLVARGVRLVCDIGVDLPPVVCDRRRIGQILTNLVSNAIKFTEKGEIVVHVVHDINHESVVIHVRDTGIGIAENELASIFEEYRQAGSAKRRKKGTGLGLAIARSIATHHGGSLTVESTLGEGSCFALTLPVNPSHRPSAIDMTEEAARAVHRAQQRPENSGARLSS